MRQQYDTFYPFLIKGTTVLVSPFIYLAFESINIYSRTTLGLSLFIQTTLLIGFGTLFSLPTLIVLWLSFTSIMPLELSLVWKKIICIIITQIGIGVTFYFLTGSVSIWEFNLLEIIYALTAIVSGFYFRVKLTTTKKAA